MSARGTRQGRQRGLTLVELVVVVALVALVLGIGAPASQHLVERHRAATVTNVFSSGLQNARAEAVRRGERVAFCARAEGGWVGGYVIRTGDSCDGAAERLFSYRAVEGLEAISGPEGGVVFHPSGRRESGGEGLHFEIRAGSRAPAREVHVARTGRVHVEVQGP